MYRGANGYLKGSSYSSFPKETDKKGRGLVESCTADESVKVLDSKDCGIELGNGNEGKFVILGDNMKCDNFENNPIAITISAPGVTLDCKNLKVQNTAADPPFITVGIHMLADNIALKNCDISGFHDGILLGQSATDTIQNIHLLRVHSHDNTGDGIDVRSSLSGVVVAKSQFNNNRESGVDFFERSAISLTNIFMSSVVANKNKDDGFALKGTVNGLLVDVEAIGNEGDGVEFSRTNGPLSIQDSAFCNNTDTDFDGSQFSGFSHHAITCNKQDIGIGNLCDCSCPEFPV